ncbi:hypothetical protein LWI28_006553 [Acer negundo]|uniref:ABC transmembrane type-1 domain-containing protein n=1 Tax=Acer negundo TaxID=4023 RepID=A0AAD5IZH2_ACENE|nr:hypothetical protein LWI28_006553 [Acer negundo]
MGVDDVCGSKQVANDAVGSIRIVASFSAEEKVMKLYQKKCEGPMKAGIRQGLINGAGFGLSFFMLYCVYATSFYAGALLEKYVPNMKLCTMALSHF